MTPFIVTVFVLVYLGMLLGGLHWLQLDRTGVVLLGAIALVATEAVLLDRVWQAVHLPTLALLFAFMVISALQPKAMEASKGQSLAVIERNCWSE